MQRRMKRIAAPLAVLVSVLLSHCSPSPPARPRLVLLYVNCTLNKHFLSPYQPGLPYTPAFDRFARNAVVFERHQTEAGQSGIAFASIFSGTHADRHGAYTHPVELSDDITLLAEKYAEASYETFFWSGHPMAGPKVNYDQGVQPANLHKGGLRAEDPAFLAILDGLADNPAERAFVQTGFTVTHSPYKEDNFQSFRKEFPKHFGDLTDAEIRRYTTLYRRNHFGLAWNTEQTVAELGLSATGVERLAAVIELIYASRVQVLDRLFGAMLDAIEQRGLLDETMIVFTSDHGEVLHRPTADFQWSHAMQLAPEVIGVPLLISAPGLPGRRYGSVTSSIDVLPTMLGLSGIEVPTTAAGTDLSRHLHEGSEMAGTQAFSHTTIIAPSVARQLNDPILGKKWAKARKFFPDRGVQHTWVAVREGDLFYKWRNLDGKKWGPQLFDLARDPSETRNIFDSENPTHRRALKELRAYKNNLVHHFRRGDTLPLSEEERRLRKLGYIQ